MKKLILACCLLLVSLSLLPQKKVYPSLSETFKATAQLRGESGPSGVVWIDGGKRYSFTRREAGGQQIWTFDPEDLSEERVFSSTDHTFPGTEIPFTYHSFRWTREYKFLLFQSNFKRIWRNSGDADYYYYSLEEKRMQPIVTGAFTAEVSPDGTMVGYGKEGDLFTFDLATGRHTRHTEDGAEKYYNGRFGWANEEEFGLVQAWKWSNDSRYIAFWQSDERSVPVYSLTDYSGQHPEYTEIPYPKVGDQTPIERIGIIDLQQGSKSWLDFDPEGGYIPRIYWTARANTLALVWLNRNQNHLKLYLFDITTGEKRVILEERSDAWIDIFDFFGEELDLFHFPRETESFFWISDRDGYSHIYHYDYQGNLLGRLTQGSFDVVGIKGIDTGNKRIYYTSCEASPLERHLYSVAFSGKRKIQITHVPGLHDVDMAPSGQYFIDSHSDVNTPSTVDLRDRNGDLVIQLAGHARTDAHLDEYVYAGKELFRFTTSDGQEIDGFLIRPVDFNPGKKYPLIMDVYGGPGAQGVYNSFETSGWHQYLAQMGYVVANINNRGSGGYGRDFERVVYLQLGNMEAYDFAEAAHFLSEKPWIDRKNIGIMGHSYGGFSAGMSLLKYPGIFKAGIVASATADHLNYNAIYTERYMGFREQNPEGYRNSSMITFAGNLQGYMMVVHGLMDDNVHPQNAFQLVTAMTDQEKGIELKIFPPGNHGVAYDMRSRIFLYQGYLDFFERHLKGIPE